MKVAFWAYVIGQIGLLVASFFGVMTIWQAVMPTVALATLVAIVGVFAMALAFIVDFAVDDKCMCEEGEEGSEIDG